MAVALTVNGVTFNYPQTNDEDWGGAATGWAQAVTQGMLQKAGGAFTLTAEVDFGSGFGLRSLYYRSRAANAAASGEIRLGNTEGVAWRNAANSADLELLVNGSDQLEFNGNLVPLVPGALTASRALETSAGGVIQASTVTATELGYLSGVTSAIQTQINSRLPLAGGTMTGALLAAAGTAALPSLAFSGDSNTGFFSAGADVIGASAGGTARVWVTSDGLLVGTLSNPNAWAQRNSTNVNAGATLFGIANTSNGSSASAGLRFENDVDVSGLLVRHSSANTTYAGANSLNIGLTSANALGFVTNNILRAAVLSNGSIRLQATTSGFVDLKPADTTTSYTLTLPNSAGTTGHVLQTDGAGVTSWVAQAGATTPSGTVAMFAGSSAPTGWLLCDGSPVSRTTFSALFAIVGTTYGAGDGSTTFNLPDCRGLFVRGVGAGAAIGGITYTGPALGTRTGDAMQGHMHFFNNAGTDLTSWTSSGTAVGLTTPLASGGTANAYAQQIGNPRSDGTNGTPRTASETRPANITMNYIIKT